MKRSLSLLAVGALAIFASATGVLAVPKPATVPTVWELDFQHKTPRRITVGQNAFWYLVFTVTNPTVEEQNFLPTFDMMTEDGSFLPAEKGVADSAVFEAIKKRENNKLLEPLAKVRGRLLSGEDQARTSVAIWPEPNLRMGKFKIFVGGLSGEAQMKIRTPEGKLVDVPDPVAAAKDETIAKSIIYLWKTLQLEYEVWGDEIDPGHDPVKDKTAPNPWIMR